MVPKFGLHHLSAVQANSHSVATVSLLSRQRGRTTFVDEIGHRTVTARSLAWSAAGSVHSARVLWTRVASSTDNGFHGSSAPKTKPG